MWDSITVLVCTLLESTVQVLMYNTKVLCTSTTSTRILIVKSQVLYLYSASTLLDLSEHMHFLLHIRNDAVESVLVPGAFRKS